MKPHGHLVEIKERTYGGKSGIWLKKKRHHNIASNHSTLPSFGGPRSQSATSICDSVMGPIDETSSFQGEVLNTSKSNIIVDWDGIRCRPIYRNIDEDKPALKGDASAGNLDWAAEDAISDEDENILQETSQTEDVAVANDWAEEMAPKKGRSYGSRKRTLAFPIMDESKRKRVSNESESGLNATPISTPLIKRNLFLSTPQVIPFSDSICAALDSEAKTTPLCRQITDPMEGFVSVDVPQCKKEELKTKRLAVKRKKSGSQQLRGAKLEMDEEALCQPSSKTSLDAARAFFERLDSTQKLTLDSSDIPLDPRKPCVRTTRMISISSPSLREEYNTYVSVIEEPGIRPLSLKEYAESRSAFFRAKEMFDGFLDE